MNNNPLNVKEPVKGETDIQFHSLPSKKPREVQRVDPDLIQDDESYKFLELEEVKYYLQLFGDNPARIAMAVGISQPRAKKLIEDVYNISWGVNGKSSAEQRRRMKKLHTARLDIIIEHCMDKILNGHNGKELSPSELKTMSSQVQKALEHKEKLEGIGNTVVFEQFNTQTNVNVTIGQQHLEREKTKRFLLEQLQKSAETEIIEGEIIDE